MQKRHWGVSFRGWVTLLVALVGVPLVGVGCSSATEKDSPRSGNLFDDPKAPVTFRYPIEWGTLRAENLKPSELRIEGGSLSTTGSAVSIRPTDIAIDSKVGFHLLLGSNTINMGGENVHFYDGRYDLNAICSGALPPDGQQLLKCKTVQGNLTAFFLDQGPGADAVVAYQNVIWGEYRGLKAELTTRSPESAISTEQAIQQLETILENLNLRTPLEKAQ